MPKAPDDGCNYVARGNKWVNISDTDDSASDKDFDKVVDATINKFN